MKKYRSYAMILSVVGMALLLVGVTYSFFNYTKTGGANNLGTGDISFDATYGTAINLTNVFPMTSSEASEANLSSTTVGISGSTEYSDGEEFLVSIVDVNNTINGKKIPMNYIATYTAANNGSIGTSTDNYFEVSKNANIYKLNSTGGIVEDKQVLVGFIKGGTDGVNGTLTIKAYVDADRIAITDTPEENSSWVNGRTVFSTTEWSSFQGNNAISFKLRTESNEGVWVEEPEPDNVTPESCFTKRAVTVYTVNNNMTQTELNDCVSYMNSFNLSVLNDKTTEDYCLGNAQTYRGDFQAALDVNSISLANSHSFDLIYLVNHNIIIPEVGVVITGYNPECGNSVVIPNTMEFSRYVHNKNMTESELATCADYYSNTLGWYFYSDLGESAEGFCAGTSVTSGQSLQDSLDANWYNSESYTYLINHNIISLTSPAKYKVLAYDSDYNSFRDLVFEGVTINKDMKIIYHGFGGAVVSNVLDITIPASVRYIGSESFAPYYSGAGFDSIPTGTFTILGNPFISSYSIDEIFEVSYGGTCQELYNHSIGYEQFNRSTIIYGGEGNHNIVTTDTNTCSVNKTCPD